MKRACPQRWVASISAIGALAGVGCLMAFLLSGSQERVVGAFTGGVVALAAGSGALIAWRRARSAERLLADPSVLARWSYERSTAASYLDDLSAEECDAFRRLFFAGGGTAGAGAILLSALDPSRGMPGLVALFVLVLLFGGAAQFGPRLLRAQREKTAPEAVISSGAAYVLGTLHVWAPARVRIREAGIVPGEVPMLRVVYSGRGLLGGSESVVSIPVAAGSEPAAVDAVHALQECIRARAHDDRVG